MGGYGCGKTDGGVKKVAHLAMHPNNRILVGRHTATDLADTTQRDLMEFLHQAELVHTPPNTKTNRCIVYCIDPVTGRNLGYQSEVQFVHLDNPVHLRGKHIGAAWIDEASETKVEAYKNLVGRLRLPTFAGKYTMLITGNVEGQNWCYDLAFNKERLTSMICGHPSCKLTPAQCNKAMRLKVRGIHGRSLENYFLPPSYTENMLASYTSAERRRYMEGEFSVFEGAVFSEFDAQLHVLDIPRETGLEMFAL